MDPDVGVDPTHERESHCVLSVEAWAVAVSLSIQWTSVMLEAVLLAARTSESEDECKVGAWLTPSQATTLPTATLGSFSLEQEAVAVAAETPRRGNAAQVLRPAAKAERQRKAQANCMASFRWICEVSCGAYTVHVDSKASLLEKEAGAVALPSRAQVTSRECTHGKKTRPTAHAERLLVCVALVFETTA